MDRRGCDMSEIDRLIEEFRTAYVTGGRPDAGDYVAQVPEGERAELGRRIRVLLVETPPPEPAPETLLGVQAMLRGEQPLLQIRVSKGLTRDQVVAGLRDRLGIPVAKEARVTSYYHEMETGQLPLAGIRDRVFDALSQVLGVARGSMVLRGPDPSQAGGSARVFARASGPEGIPDVLASLPNIPEAAPDEVDDLFTGGRA